MGPSVSESQLETVMKYVEIGKSEGARPSGRSRLTSGAHSNGWFHQPTVFGDVEPTMRIAQEEIFGPVVSVMRCGSLDQAIEIGNSVAYGLSASIYTRDINKAFTAMRDMYTGIFYVNAPTIGAEVHLPFGARRPPAMVIAKQAPQRSMCSRSGNRSTWISAASCNARR